MSKELPSENYQDTIEGRQTDVDATPVGREVPPDFFSGCTTYAEILAKTDELAKDGRRLEESEYQFDAATLQRLIADVMAEMEEWDPSLPVPPRKLFGDYLGRKGFTRASGFRDAMVEAVIAYCAARSEEQATLDAARDRLG